MIGARSFKRADSFPVRRHRTRGGARHRPTLFADAPPSHRARHASPGGLNGARRAKARQAAPHQLKALDLSIPFQAAREKPARSAAG
jgi:hypothetical protein